MKKFIFLVAILAIAFAQLDAQGIFTDPGGNRLEAPPSLITPEFDCTNNNGVSITSNGNTSFTYFAGNAGTCNAPVA